MTSALAAQRDALSPIGRRRDLISVVSPVYNEEENLRPHYEAIVEVARDRDFDVEIVLVNDGSRDRSEEVIQELAARDPRVRAVSFSRNFGAIAACNAGLRTARGDGVILISADLQDPASLIPRFVEAWRGGADIVWAVRETRSDPFSKKLFARLFYGAIRRLAFPDYPENGTDCGLFSRRVIDVYNLLPERDSNPFFTLFSLGFRQARIGYDRRARERGVSSWTFWRRVKNCIDIITTFSYAPLRLISTTGFLFSTLAAIYALFLIVRRAFFDLGGEGWTSLAVLIVFIGGALALFIGIIAEYVWRIGEHTRQRPRYIIAARHGAAALEHAETAGDQPLDALHIDVSHLGHGAARIGDAQDAGRPVTRANAAE